MAGLFKTSNHVEDLALFTRHLAGAMNARAPLPDVLRAYARESEGGRLNRAIDQAADLVEAGGELSAALEEYPRPFPPAYRRLVRLGEQGRMLGGVMSQLADSLEEGLKNYEYFRRAAIYPLLITVMLFLDVCFILTLIMPKLTDVYSSVGESMNQLGGYYNHFFLGLPDISRLVMLLFALGLLVPIGYLAATVMGLKVTALGYGRMVLGLPLVAPVLRRAETARFANNLALLLRNRIPMAEALGLLAESANNVYVRDAVRDFQERFVCGERLGEMIAAQPLFPPTMAVMIASAEDQGGLVETLESLGRFYTERTAHGLTVLREVFEPMMLVLVGLLVGLILVSVYMPIFQIPRMGVM